MGVITDVIFTTIMRCPLSCVRMTAGKAKHKTRGPGRDVENLEHVHSGLGLGNGIATVENSTAFLQKRKNRITTVSVRILPQRKSL